MIGRDHVTGAREAIVPGGDSRRPDRSSRRAACAMRVYTRPSSPTPRRQDHRDVVTSRRTARPGNVAKRRFRKLISTSLCSET